MPTYCGDFQITKIKTEPQVRASLGDLDELMPSIKEHGVLTPISLMEDWTLITGHRRLEASKRLGLTTIKALIYPMLPPLEVKIMRLTENLQRAGMTEQDIHRGAASLLEDGLPRVEIAKRLGVSPTTVTRWLSPLECPPEAVDKFFNGPLTLGQMDKIRVSPEPLVTMKGFLGKDPQEKAARKPKPKDSARLETVKVPLPGGQVVTITGEGLSLEDAVEAMDEAKKAVAAAIKRGLNSKTAQRVFADVAAAG